MTCKSLAGSAFRSRRRKGLHGTLGWRWIDSARSCPLWTSEAARDDAIRRKASPPLDDHGLGKVQHRLNLFVPPTLGGQQYDWRPQNITLGGSGGTYHGFEFHWLLRSQFDWGCSTGHHQAR